LKPSQAVLCTINITNSPTKQIHNFRYQHKQQPAAK
jgi:hypothetical protein